MTKGMRTTGRLHENMEWMKQRVAALKTEHRKITDLLEFTEEHLKRTTRLSKALTTVTAILTAPIEWHETLQEVIAASVAALGCDAGALWLRDGESWVVNSVYNLSADLIGTCIADDQQPQIAQAVKTGSPVEVDAAGEQRITGDAHSSSDRRAGIIVPVAAKGTVVGLLFFCYEAAGAVFTDEQIECASMLSGAVSLALENAQARKTIQEYEARCGALFSTMTEGFAYYKILSDGVGEPVDYAVIDVNAAFEKLTGLEKTWIIGKTIAEMHVEAGEEIHDWIARCSAIAAVGEQIRFEHYSKSRDRWFAVCALVPQAGYLVVLLRDISAQKEKERHARFLEDLTAQINRFSNPGNLLQVVAESVRNHLSVSHCLLGEIDQKVNQMMEPRKRRRGIGALTGTQSFSYLELLMIDDMEAGRTVINCDAKADPRTAQCFERESVQDEYRAYLAVPLQRDGRWAATFWVSTTVPRLWSEHEVALVEMVAHRVWFCMEKARLHAALHGSEERFRLAVEAAGMATWDIDVRTSCAVWSESYFRILGLNPAPGGSTTMEQWRKCIHPDDLPRVLQAMKVARLQRSRYELEHRAIRADNGQIVWVRAFGEFLYDQSGEAVRFLGVLFDNTQRKQVEESLRESERRLSLIMDAAGMATWEVDVRTGNAVWSENHFRLFGLKPAADGKATMDLWLSRIHPDDLSAVMQALKTARSSHSLCSFEYRIIRADNAHIAWLRAFARFLYGANGEAVRLSGVLFDDTQRKRMETDWLDTIRRKEQILALLNALFESAPIGLSFWDKDLRLVKFNKAMEEISDLFTSDHVGKAVDELVPQLTGNQQLLADMRRVLETGERKVDVEVSGATAASPDQPRHWLHTWYPVQMSGDIVGIVAAVSDITGRKQAEEKLKQYMDRINTVMRVFQNMLAESSIEGLLQRMVDAACALTTAGSGAARYGSGGRWFQVVAPLNTGPFAPGEVLSNEQCGACQELFQQQMSIRLTEEELKGRHTRWEISEGRALRHGLLAVRLIGRSGQAAGVIMVSGEEAGEFTEEDEALLLQLAGLASYGLQNLEARAEGERRVAEVEALMEAMPAVTWISRSPDCQTISGSRSTYELLRVPAAGNLSKAGRGGTVPSYSKVLKNDIEIPVEDLPIHLAARGKEIRDFELKVRFDDGTFRYLLGNATPLRLERGKAAGAIAVFLDITGRKRNEQALREREKRLHSAIVSAALGVLEWDVERDQAVWANERVYKLFGLTPEDGSLSMAEFMSVIYPDDAEQFDRYFHEDMIEGRVRQTVCRICREDGELCWVKFSGRFELGHDRKSLRLISALRDITEQKRAEEMRHEAEQRMRCHVENSPLAVIEWDGNFRVMSWSSGAERVFGWKAEEVMGKHPTEWSYVHTQGRADADGIIEGLLSSSEQCMPSPTTSYRRDGTAIRCEWYNSRLVNEHGQLMSIVSQVLNISGSDRSEATPQCSLSQENDERSRAEEANACVLVTETNDRSEPQEDADVEQTDEMRREERLRLLSETASQLLEIENPHAIVEGLGEMVMRHLACDVFFNYVLDQDRQCLRLNACSGIPAEIARDIEYLDYNAAVSGCVAQNGIRIVAENNPETDDRRTGLFRSLGIKAYACHPLFFRGGVIGSLSFGSSSRLAFTKDQLSLIKVICDQVGAALGRNMTIAQLSRSCDELKRQVEEQAGEVAAVNEQLDRLFSCIDGKVAYLDKDFNFIRVNRDYAEADERTPDFYVGKNHFALFPHEENEQILRRVVETGEAYTMYGTPLTGSGRCERNHTYWDWKVKPVKSPDGSVGGVILSLTDVTEVWRAQQALHEHEDLLRAVLEAMPIGVWIMDKQGHIVHRNAAGKKLWDGARTVKSIQSEEYKGRLLGIAKAIKPEVWAGARAIILGETLLDEEIEVQYQDGSRKAILTSAVPLRNQHGITGAVVINQDITRPRTAKSVDSLNREP